MGTTRKIYIARSVNFNEKDFPFFIGFLQTNSKSLIEVQNHNFSTAPLVLLKSQPLNAVSTSMSSNDCQKHNISNYVDISNPVDQVATINNISTDKTDFTTETSLVNSSNTHCEAVLPEISSDSLSNMSNRNIIINSKYASIYPMQTTSKSGIFQHKVFTTNQLVDNHDDTKPATIQEALIDPKWKGARDQEYEALVENKTWSLVPFCLGMNLV